MPGISLVAVYEIMHVKIGFLEANCRRVPLPREELTSRSI
jgi:hypothetical protein